MVKNEKFNIYDFGCKLDSGREITVNRSITARQEDIIEDLSQIINSNTNFIKELAELQQEEKAIFEEVKEKLGDWQNVAEKIYLMKIAQEYDKKSKDAEEMETTNNKWTFSSEHRYDRYRISNKSYKMSITLYRNTTYRNGKEEPVSWDIKYYLHANAEGAPYIKCVEKKFTDEEKAMKYIEGRKKYFASYFQELWQPLKEEDKKYFMFYGKLLRNYRVEE